MDTHLQIWKTTHWSKMATSTTWQLILFLRVNIIVKLISPLEFFLILFFFHKNLWNSIFLICLQILFALMDERLVSSTARVLGQTCIFKTALIQWPPSGFLTKSQPLVQQRGSKVTVSLPWVSASHLFLFNISIFCLWVRYIPFVNIVALTNRDNVISVKVTML